MFDRSARGYKWSCQPRCRSTRCRDWTSGIVWPPHFVHTPEARAAAPLNTVGMGVAVSGNAPNFRPTLYRAPLVVQFEPSQQ